MKNAIIAGERIYLSTTDPEEAMTLAGVEAVETDTLLYTNERLQGSPIAFSRLIRELGQGEDRHAIRKPTVGRA
ncbi:MAG: hypothetical protein ACOC9Y_09980 [Chloroflexota bacterium]